MNKVILMGRLTKDVELKDGDTPRCNGSIAVDKGLSKEKKKELEAANKPTADFVNFTIFGNHAKSFAKWTKKGARVLLEGSISVNTVGEGDEKKIYTNINVFKTEIIDFNSEESSGGSGDISSDDVSEDDIPF